MRRAEQKDGRVLSKQISLSETMADLGDPVIIMIATWLIPHADDQGRLPAQPRRLKAQVFPMIEAITSEAIAAALQRMAAVGMITLYAAADGLPLLQFLSWWKWNDGQRWVYPSAYPPPPGWTDVVRDRTNTHSSANGGQCPPPSDSGRYGGGEEEEGGLELEYGAGAGVGAPSDAGTAFTTYEQEIGLLTPIVAQDITDLLDGGIPPGWIAEACREASRYNKRSWGYARRIVERWRAEGRGPPNTAGASHLTPAQAETLRQKAAALEAGDG